MRFKIIIKATINLKKVIFLPKKHQPQQEQIVYIMQIEIYQST